VDEGLGEGEAFFQEKPVPRVQTVETGIKYEGKGKN